MLPLIIIIVLVVAGIALLCIDRNRNAEMLKDIELLKQTREECASLAHPADKTSRNGHISTSLVYEPLHFVSETKTIKKYANDKLPKSKPKGSNPSATEDEQLLKLAKDRLKKSRKIIDHNPAKQPAKYKGKVIPKGWKKYAVSRMPVAPDAIVSVMYDDGTISPFSPDKAGRWDWEWDIKGGTIIAYKTHEPKNKKRVTIRKKVKSGKLPKVRK